jgi:hypothetical protein
MTQLKWVHGTPQYPGKYLFRFSIGHPEKGLALMVKLLEPTAYRYKIVEVYEDGKFLLRKDFLGQERIVKGEGLDISVWYAKLPQ